MAGLHTCLSVLRQSKFQLRNYVISGHGPNTEPAIDPKSIVKKQRVYLEELMAAVKGAKDTGTHSPDALRQAVKLPKYKDWRYYEK